MDTTTRPDQAGTRLPSGLWRLGLSLKALGLLVVLLDVAQDPGAPLSVAELQRLTGEGRDRIQGGLAELERRGLLIRYQSRGASGQLGSSQWLVDPQGQLSAMGQ